MILGVNAPDLFMPSSSSADEDHNTGNDDHGKQEEEEYGPSHDSASAVVICSVDGTVYTLDPWSGNLRGISPAAADAAQ